MDKKLRDKRTRLLVSKVNKERKKLNEKLDIVCNNLIAAHKDFINTLNALVFTANFYESMLGVTNLKDLFYCAGKLIREELGEVNVAFFLPQEDNFELYVFEKEHKGQLDWQNLVECFKPELIDAVCKTNQICRLESLVAVGLQANPATLNKISATTIPLGQFGVSQGFILIYRDFKADFTEEELNRLLAVSHGFARAIQSHKVPCSAN